jgi:hypothetical protein
VRLSILIVVLECVSALVLAVTLYGITRVEDHELAVLAWCVALPKACSVRSESRTTWDCCGWRSRKRDGRSRHPHNKRAAYISADAGPERPHRCDLLCRGSLIFSYLLLRGRMVPVSIAWLGVFASGLLAVALPLQLAGFPTGC